MRMNCRRGLATLMVAFLSSIFAREAFASEVGSNFSYQGVLASNGIPAQGSFEIVFSLQDAATGGNQVGQSLTNGNVQVVSGVFTADLNFGSAPFDGTALWLDIALRPAGSGEAFTQLTPRQAVNAVPYALHALDSVTPAQLAQATASIQGQISSLAPATNAFIVAPTITDPEILGATFSGSGNPATWLSTGTNVDSGFTLQNGFWANSFYSPVAYLQPTALGSSMILDLMPRGTNSANSWIDICDRDVTINQQGFWEALNLEKHADDYAQIGTSTLGGVVRDLILQHNGGQLGVGIFDTLIRPSSFMQIRPQMDANFGVDAHNGGIRLSAFPDSQSSRLPLRAEASSFFFSADGFGSPLLFTQFRPATNVNISIDNAGSQARIAAFNDSGNIQIPMIYQMSEHHFLTSYGSYEPLSIVDNSVGISQKTPNQSLAFEVGGTDRPSLPHPPVTTAQRSAMVQVPDGAQVFNKDVGAPEFSVSGHWFRQGQRPSVAFTVAATNSVPDSTDVLLVKGSGPRQVVLPAAADWANRVIEIKDASFHASQDTITISSAGGLVENAATLSIASDGGVAWLISDGTDWFKIN